MGSRPSKVSWHSKGDYFLTVQPKAGKDAVLIHQLTKGRSQRPFGKSKGEISDALFHPKKPFLFAATVKDVRVYHLVKQTMVKKLTPNVKHITSLSIHPTGDHVIVGSLDRKHVWFDLDLSTNPYKSLKYHTAAVRTVAFHPRHPLMASAGDSGHVHVFHSRVYDDLMRNPLIVPVKILRGAHDVRRRLGVLNVVWHPRMPWVFTCGADGGAKLWQDL